MMLSPKIPMVLAWAVLCTSISACGGGQEAAPDAAVPVPSPEPQSAPATPQTQVQVQGELEVSDAWIRLPVAGAPVAGGYLTLHNGGAQDDRLLSVRTEAADRVEIHEMRMEGELMQMRELPGGVQVPAGQSVRLEPGGTHLMFMQPVPGLALGSEVDAVLVFEQAGERSARFQVRDERGQGGHAAH